MKFKLNKNDFLANLQIVQNVVSTKVTLPILSNILLKNYNNKLIFFATDLDIGICCEKPVQTIEEGSISVPAKRLADIIREMPEGEISVQAKKNHQIEIEGAKCRFKLNGLPPEEFPKFPEFKDQEVFSLDQEVLRGMLRMTMFAVSHEEVRYVLNGILMEIEARTLRLVATDGRRLAKMEAGLTEGGSGDKRLSVILPYKAVQEIMRNLKEDGPMVLMTGANQILFDIGGVKIASRIIEGEFPDYNRVIPDPVSPAVEVRTEAFLSALRRASLLATQDFQAVKVELFSDKLVVSKVTPDVGESREEIPIRYGGKEFIVGFNPQYLIDVLKILDDETVAVEFLGPDKAAVIRKDDYLYLALPMRL